MVIDRSLRFLPSRSRSGQATLSLVFLIGGIVILIGVTLAFVAITLINSGYGFQAANRALAAADGGVDDAYMRLVRNKSFSSVIPYSVSVGVYTASVTVTQDDPVAGRVTVVSESTVQNYRRRIRAIFSVSTSTGEVNLASRNQLTL